MAFYVENSIDVDVFCQEIVRSPLYQISVVCTCGLLDTRMLQLRHSTHYNSVLDKLIFQQAVRRQRMDDRMFGLKL